VVVPLGPLAHTKLDAEIEADTNKQGCKCDRDQIERADHQQAECRCGGQSDDEVEHYGKDNPRRAQCEPKDEEDGGDAYHGVEGRTLLKSPELVVVDRHSPGEPNARLVTIGEVEILGRSLDCVSGGKARLQCAEI